MSSAAPGGLRRSGIAMQFLALLGFALMLGACTKCDVPTWQRSSNGDAPVACHDSPAPQ
jgi:hypothetical protein